MRVIRRVSSSKGYFSQLLFEAGFTVFRLWGEFFKPEWNSPLKIVPKEKSSQMSTNAFLQLDVFVST